VEADVTRNISQTGRGHQCPALTDEPRPVPEKVLDHAEESAIVAMVCGPPPEGSARWSVRLVAREAKKRGIVKKIERETARQLLARHDLKPWREENVVRAGDPWARQVV
jgi:nucleotide-binding universal stress UspA family protein